MALKWLLSIVIFRLRATVGLGGRRSRRVFLTRGTPWSASNSGGKFLAHLDEIEADDLAVFIAGFARQYGVDPVKAVEALNQPALAAMVDKDLADGVARGVVKTPTVFVDGAPFVETFTVEAISQAIETAITTHK